MIALLDDLLSNGVIIPSEVLALFMKRADSTKGLSEMQNQAEQITEQLTEILGKSDHLAITGSHKLLVQGIFSALGPAFIGDSDGLILFVTSDKVRADKLKSAIWNYHSEIDLPQIQFTTPCFIEQLVTANREQFEQMVKSCRRFIFWTEPCDFEDNALEYWLSLYRELPLHIPVAYLGTDLPEERLNCAHSNLIWLKYPVQNNGMKPFLWYVSDKDSAENEIEPDFWEMCKGRNTLVTCRNEQLKLKYSELSSRAHISVYSPDSRKKQKQFQYLTSNALSEFELPDVNWKHYCAIDPRPEDDVRSADQFLEPQSPVSVIATNRFSMLLAAAKPLDSRKYRQDEVFWLNVFRLFSKLQQRALTRSDIDFDEAELCLSFWLETGIAASTGRTIELARAGQRLFPGISCFAQLGTLHNYKHQTVCKTRNHEMIGEIETDFLQKQTGFYLAGKLWHKHFHNQLGGEATLCVKPECASYLDDLPVVCHAQTMNEIRKLIYREIEPESVVLSSKCALELEILRRRFETDPANNFIETARDCAHWWTFAGLENNAIFALILGILAPKLHIAYGNFYLRLSWPMVSEDCMPKVVKRLEEIASQICKIKQNGLPESMKKAILPTWKQNHTYGWLFCLVPERLQMQALERDFQNAFSTICDEIPAIIQREMLRTIDDNQDIFAEIQQDEPTVSAQGLKKTSEPVQSRSIGRVADKTSEFDSNRVSSPVREGIMHTRYPWTYVNTDQKLAKALNIILKQAFIGLDVETTLYDQRLCLIQIGCADQSFLIDPLSVDFSGLEQVFANPGIIKVIHNATFEKTVMGKYGIPILNIVDTMTVSRKLYGMKCPGGHSLKAVCNREFGFDMSKECQTSRWEQRPLSPEQLEYAALDAEILIHLYRHFNGNYSAGALPRTPLKG